MKRITVWFSALVLCLSLACQVQTQTLFFEDFESGLGAWDIRNGLITTSDRPFEGSFCGSFTFQTTGSFADRTADKFPVVAGQQYMLEVAYRTDGGGGYIGIDKFGSAGNALGEQWLIGDGGDPSNLSTWDCNVVDCPSSAIGVWKTYHQAYEIPAGVSFVDIKIEDFRGGLPNGPPICFDNISWSIAQLDVDIDIKPGSATNSINLGSAGVIPVAILSSSTFDALSVDPQSVALAGAGVRLVGKSNKYLAHEEDVNGDGLMDLVCKVETAQFMIEPGESIAVLEGETFSGVPIKGEDSIQIVP